MYVRCQMDPRRTAMLRGRKHAVRKLERAQILPAADAGLGDGAIAADPGQRLTIYRTKPRFVEGNPEAAR